jgi:hypothetical protein
VSVLAVKCEAAAHGRGAEAKERDRWNVPEAIEIGFVLSQGHRQWPDGVSVLDGQV